MPKRKKRSKAKHPAMKKGKCPSGFHKGKTKKTKKKCVKSVKKKKR